MIHHGRIQTKKDFLQSFEVIPHCTAGYPIGIITVDLPYPKLPGNVANATTFTFPVLYQKVQFEIESLFEGKKEIEETIVNAAKTLEAEGVRAIVGACGYFAHFQRIVAKAVSIPVYLSSLCQIPVITLGLKSDQKILILAASGKDLNQGLFQKLGIRTNNFLIQDIGSLDSFAPIRWSGTRLDNRKLTEDLVEEVCKRVAMYPKIGAILLECSDLPPYALSIQEATGLPVFDFNTMINWVESAVVQRGYVGYI